MKALILIMLLTPLAGALLNALAGRALPRRGVSLTACLAVLISLAAALAALLLRGAEAHDLTLFAWIKLGPLNTAMDVHYDSLAALMALMVTFVASIIHLYSTSFMRDDSGLVRYFVYLNLFVFAMLVVTLSDSLVFMYLGWEGVGFCSYALIGFWYGEEANASAGRKAFLFTRLGDIAFGVLLALCLVWLGELSITGVNAQAASLSSGAALVLGLLLFWAAAGKSAQLPLSVWLPDAMAGPSPVSALIHAATMVTAGVYLLMRMFPVLAASPWVLWLIAGVGAITALWAALAALAQHDIKRVLAYSTISQVGYMFLAVGASDIVAGMFHLLSHAFFKSLLFLAAGCVIKALDEEHNIFKMGNLRRLMPAVGALFLIGALCLSAFPLLGGYFSKDRILLAAFTAPGLSYKLFWAAGFLAALLTPLYTFRVYFIAFGSRHGGRTADQVSKLPRLLTWVLWPLAALALGDGLLNVPLGPGKHWLARFLDAVPGARLEVPASGSVELGMALASAAGVLAAIALAAWLYRGVSAEPRPTAWREALFHALYLDRFYELFLVRPYRATAEFLWKQFDDGGLDLGFTTLGQGLSIFSRGLAAWSNGRLSLYLLMMVVALVSVLGVLAWSWFAW
ncbi:MAG: NADH-quinone oxidoreductase subunit L [Deltaproteobacteria bacterium]|nr:NADH-quinone oxidoreductase subunit L [Deltaproteobacteria bacterium]